MTLLVDQCALKNLADLIDAVGELIAAILDRNDGVAALDISAIDIGNPAHPLSCFDRSKKRRARWLASASSAPAAMPYRGLILVRPLSRVMPSVSAIVKPELSAARASTRPLAQRSPTAIGASACFSISYRSAGGKAAKRALGRKRQRRGWRDHAKGGDGEPGRAGDMPAHQAHDDDVRARRRLRQRDEAREGRHRPYSAETATICRWSSGNVALAPPTAPSDSREKVAASCGQLRHGVRLVTANRARLHGTATASVVISERCKIAVSAKVSAAIRIARASPANAFSNL